MPTATDLLAFESRPWRNAGAKERAILDDLGLTANRYYQLVRRAMVDPAAVAAHPGTAARLRRIVEQSRRPLADWSRHCDESPDGSPSRAATVSIA